MPVTNWLLGEGHDVAACRMAVGRYERFLASDEPRSDDDLADFARLRVSAGDDLEEPGLLTPADAHTPLELAYSAGRWRGSRRIVGAGELVLARYAPQWFDEGSTTRLAAWLKIVYWDTGVTADPDDAMRRLLDLLPSTSRSTGDRRDRR